MNLEIIEEKGELNHRRTSRGKNDECWTERYAVEPLLEFMEPFRDKIIWCPFDTEESEFVKVFQEKGFNVVYSHINYDQDFFYYEPVKWDIIISNSQYTGKREIMERVLGFNKPFALIYPLAWLDDGPPCKLFRDSNLQLLIPIERMEFKNQQKKGKINFKGVYYCKDFLPRDLMFTDFSDRNQLNLLEDRCHIQM